MCRESRFLAGLRARFGMTVGFNDMLLACVMGLRKARGFDDAVFRLIN
jgi:hypothetical protein